VSLPLSRLSPSARVNPQSNKSLRRRGKTKAELRALSLRHNIDRQSIPRTLKKRPRRQRCRATNQNQVGGKWRQPLVKKSLHGSRKNEWIKKQKLSGRREKGIESALALSTL
jgi:hypothetical protein